MSEPALAPPAQAAIVGVLNITPDSFSDGGRFMRGGQVEVAAVLAEARALVAAGAAILDVGGESTRPNAAPVSPDCELRRVLPVVQALSSSLPVPISIDTRRASVAEAALRAGASVVNDVSGLRCDAELARVVARRGAQLVLGHMRGEPAAMQRQVRFANALEEVAAELEESAAAAVAAGVPRSRLAVDPGIGFGKRLSHNLALLANVGALRRRLALPVWVGPSRKSFLGEITGDPISARDLSTHCAAAIAVFQGADAVRVHDVAGARRAVAVASALRGAREKGARECSAISAA